MDNMGKSQTHRITSRNQLSGQVWGIFSINGVKAKLFSFGQHQALFSVLTDGKYREWNHTIALGEENNNTTYGHHKPKKKKNEPITVIDLNSLPTNEIYKIGHFKWSRWNQRI